jgi:hypothetical protein
MSKIRSSNSIASIQRKIKEGRGQGHFSEYKPWLTVHDVPSTGVVTRILGWKSGRLHHYLSEHFELAHHYQMEWSEQVIDIREQFPLLPLDKTLYIAEKLGIKHPTDPKNKLPIIMTTDMLLTVKQEESIKFIAHSIKPSKKLTKRVVEKLQIEKEFFKDQKIEWALITERQINYNLVRNVEWLHNAKNNDKLSNHHINSLEENLYCAIQQSEKPLAKVTREQDELFGLPSGYCIQIVKYLIANRYWIVDMTHLIQPTLQSMIILENRFPMGGILF